jgi:hypothetical protein
VTAVGLSSGSLPGLTADGLGRRTLDLGGSVVDVRSGKGHAWERDGLPALRATGVDVCFVGVSTVLGDAAHPPESIGRLPWLDEGVPVKVFAAAGCCGPDRWRLTLAQVRALAARTGDSALVLAETHHGYAAVPELIELCERTRIGLVLDTLGLARIEPAPLAAAPRLAPWTMYAQVKGFDPDAPDGAGHRPLAAANAEWTRRLLTAAGTLRAVTVESRAPSLGEDVGLIRQWLSAPESLVIPEETST